jgi:hypothetical protein
MNGLYCLLHRQVEANVWDPGIKHEIGEGRYRPTSNDRLLVPMEELSVVWPEGPRHQYLHIFVQLEKGAGGEYLMRQNPRFIYVYFTFARRSTSFQATAHRPSQSCRWVPTILEQVME